MSRAQSALLNAVIFAIVFAVALWFVYVVVFGFKAYATQPACRFSASAMAKTKLLGFDSPLIKDLNCITQYFRVDEDAIRRYDDGIYRKDVLYNQFTKARSDFYVQKAVADQLAKCWGNLGRGSPNPIDPFGEYDGSSRCVVCAQFEFDSKYENVKYDEFHQFLKEHYITDEFTGAQITYWDYLTSDAKGEFNMKLETKPQSVVFISVKPDVKWHLSSILPLSPEGAASCAAFTVVTDWLGAALGRASPSGDAPSDLKLGGRVLGSRDSKGFAWLCRRRLEKDGIAGLFGAAFIKKAPSGDEIPAVVGVGLIPTGEVGRECDRLYGKG